MPTFKFEAMDTAGAEVKDSVDAVNEEEAQQKIRQMGYFVTKITEVAGKKDKKKKGPRKGKKSKTFTIGGCNDPARPHGRHHAEVREDLHRLQAQAAVDDAGADRHLALVRQVLVHHPAVPRLPLAAVQAHPFEPHGELHHGQGQTLHTDHG